MIAKHKGIKGIKMLSAQEPHNSTKHFTLSSSAVGLKSLKIQSSSAVALGIKKAKEELTEFFVSF